MKIEALAQSLEPWMRANTWHTPHPSDQERFHKALSNAFDAHGCQISYDDFKDAIKYLFEKFHSVKKLEHFEEHIDRYAAKAEYIAAYINDTNTT